MKSERFKTELITNVSHDIKTPLTSIINYVDLLEKEEIMTYREFDRPMLLDIRLGKYMNQDGSYNSAFYDYLNILKNRFEYAKNNTSLPEKPNTKAIEEIVMDVNMKIVEG